MKVATVDIGTNTVLLLVAETDGRTIQHTDLYEQRVPRLGRGVDAHGMLAPASMERTVAVLEEYTRLIAEAAPERVAVCATSAVRDAGNREEFRDLVRARTGLEVEVLSGEEEALWTFRGAISGFGETGAATVLDIGGGSTEITVGTGEEVRRRASLRIGSVRLTERRLRHDPPRDEELEAARAEVREALAAADGFGVEETALIGVAGTATALAVLDLGLPRFSLGAVVGHRLRRDRLRDLVVRLAPMRVEEIAGLSAVMEGRADIIRAGALILEEIMDRYRQRLLLVSERGVRYGLALREAIHSSTTGTA